MSIVKKRHRYSNSENAEFFQIITARFEKIFMKRYATMEELFVDYYKLDIKARVFNDRAEQKHFTDMMMRHYRKELHKTFVEQFLTRQRYAAANSTPSDRDILALFNEVAVPYRPYLDSASMQIAQKNALYEASESLCYRRTPLVKDDRADAQQLIQVLNKLLESQSCSIFQ